MSAKKSKKATINIKESPKKITAIDTQMERRNKNVRIALCLLLIAVVTAIVFSPSIRNGFINWDDNQYVTSNPDIMGLNIHNITKVFSSVYVANYQPVTMLSYIFDYQLSKLNPTVYHSTSMLWHIANAMLVFLLLYSLSGSTLVGLLTALLFSIHPLRVESVAWVAERKDVMTAFFFFLSLLLYVRHLKTPDRKLYILSIISFILSLLCKPMSVSLPIILLLLHYLTNGKFDKRAILNSIPFFAISIFFVIITLVTQNVFTHADNQAPPLSLINRICIPCFGALFYIFKTIFPVSLCSLYPFVGNSGLPVLALVSPLIVAGIIISLLYFKKFRSRTLLFGILYYLVTLLPVLQIIPVGNAMVAERYSYIPCIGLLFPLAILLKYLFTYKIQAQKNIRDMVSATLVLLIIIYSSLAFIRCSVWKDSLTLWSDVIKKQPSDVAWYYRGLAYSEQGNFPYAIQDYSMAIEKNPRHALAFDARGTAFFNIGQSDKAIEDYTKAICIVPKFATSYSNRGTAFGQKGDFKSAIADFTEAIKIYPKGDLACYSYCNRGLAYGHTGDYKKSIEDLSESIKINPTLYPQAYYFRSMAYNGLGETILAMTDLRTACNSGFDQACRMIKGQ